MILDHLANAGRYACLHPAFARAFEFLRRDDLSDLPAGRHEIDGDRLYAMVVQAPGKGRDEAKLEAHREYVDIQLSVAGTDVIGWKPTAGCRHPETEFNPETDLGLYSDDPDAWVAVPPNTFAILFPEDAHAPMGGSGSLHKVVVKVAVDE